MELPEQLFAFGQVRWSRSPLDPLAIRRGDPTSLPQPAITTVVASSIVHGDRIGLTAQHDPLSHSIEAPCWSRQDSVVPPFPRPRRENVLWVSPDASARALR